MALKAADLRVGDTPYRTPGRRSDTHADRAVRGCFGGLQPGAYGRAVCAGSGWLPDGLRARMLTMGMTGRMLTNYVGDGRLTKFGARFTSQVWPGDTLDATATVTAVGDSLVELVVSTVNQDGVEVVNGTAQARVD